VKTLDHMYNLSYLQDGYADFINRWTAHEDGEYNDGRFHASGLGQCVRKACLKRHGMLGRPDDEDKGGMFAEANFIHAGMTMFWMKSGTALARELRMVDGPFPGWSGKFDALLHRPEWCGCETSTQALRETVFDPMVKLHAAGDPDWVRYRDLLRTHDTPLLSLKSVAPAGLKHYLDSPALHHVWQDSWYAYEWARTYDLPLPKICVMYRSRGGSARPIWHFVEPVEEVDFIEELEGYNMAFDEYLGSDRLFPILPLVAKFANDKTYGEIVNLEQSWECGYCEYSGWHSNNGNFRCDPNVTTNVKADRVAVVKGNLVTIVEEWLDKYGHNAEQVTRALLRLYDQSGRTDLRTTAVTAAKQLK
jgi:hypothetical protein